MIETNEELSTVCTSGEEGGQVVMLQSYEQRLRSYKPFTCWLLLSILQQKEGESVPTVRSYLIDTLKFTRVSLKNNLGKLCEKADTLKVV